MSVSLVAFVLACAGLSSALVLTTLWVEERRRRQRRIGVTAGETGLVYLFDGPRLRDASATARRVLAISDLPGSDYDRFLHLHRADFPGLDQRLAELSSLSTVTLRGPAGLALTATWLAGLARIVISDPAAISAEDGFDLRVVRALEVECELLRQIHNSVPALLWQEDDFGRVLWANDSYLAQASRLRADVDRTWPHPRLFVPTGDGFSDQPRRQQLTDAQGAAQWFEVTARQTGNRTTLCALPANQLLSAEKGLRDFVQTLTRTFAQMRAGLAIFDSQQRLVMFNPALGELTHLRPEFLAQRPGFSDFMDALRDRRMIPEPRDYALWRENILRMAADPASAGQDSDWALPSGRTYRFCARKHAEGALALIFEDVTRDTSTSRQTRAELKIAQAALDWADDGVAVFDADGTLTLSNSAFDRIWGISPAQALSRFGMADIAKLWAKDCVSSADLDDLRAALLSGERPLQHEGHLSLRDGRSLHVRLGAGPNQEVILGVSPVRTLVPNGVPTGRPRIQPMI